MAHTEFDRISVYSRSPFGSGPRLFDATPGFENHRFRATFWTWLALFIVAIAYPGQALLAGDTDFDSLLRSMSDETLIFLLGFTIAFQWVIFATNWIAAAFEETGLAGLGFNRLRLVHIAWAVAFWLGASLVLSGIAWLMAQLGTPIAGEVGLLIPESLAGKLVWVAVAITAGVCEETAFRGYLMTRLRLVFKINNWWLPAVISSLLFGLCHLYQGIPNVVIISIYGLMFAWLFVRTRSLWPPVIAHFLNNFSVMFFPQ